MKFFSNLESGVVVDNGCSCDKKVQPLKPSYFDGIHSVVRTIKQW
jgi:hypothetical protein